jgi:predicted RNA-binding Zn-ribbon protein involved in translation (DUF1610 family)
MREVGKAKFLELNLCPDCGRPLIVRQEIIKKLFKKTQIKKYKICKQHEKTKYSFP